MNELTPLNIDALIAKEIATEYRASGNLIGYVRALLCDHDFIDSLALLIADRLNIDTQEGVNLDRIGEIVGQPRVTIEASGVAFFGFAPHPQARSFGDPSDPSVGGRFRAPGEPITGNKRLNDEEYRVFIRAKIFKNHARSTPDELILFFKLIFGDDMVVYLENATPRPGHATISFGRRLSLNEQYLLTGTDIPPMTTGVTYHIRDFPAIAFGFNGANSPVGGFGTPGVPGTGAPFRRLILN